MVDDMKRARISAQVSVIGSVLMDGKCVHEVLAEMRPEDFTGEYRRYFEAFSRLAAENTAVDPVTVLDVIGPGYEELTREIIRLTPTTANLREYIRVCKEQSRLQLLRDCGAALQGAATLDKARETLHRAEAVSTETARVSSWPAAEGVAEYFDALYRGEKPDYLQAGMPALDNALKVTAGNQIVIAGYTGHGKTALALQMAYAISRKKRVGYFLLEMSKQEISERLLSLVSQVPYENILKRELTPDEEKACALAGTQIDKTMLNFEKPPRCTIEEIRNRTRREEYDVIVVDYLQIIEGSDRCLDAVQTVTENSLSLKRMAEAYGITTFVLSQMRRAQPSGGEFVPFPRLSDLRQSGQIEQDANAVLIVHAPLLETRPDFRVLNIAKNRKGPPRSFYYTFKGDSQVFRTPTDRAYDEYVAILKKAKDSAKNGKSRNKANGAAPNWSEVGAPLDVVANGVFEQSELPM